MRRSCSLVSFICFVLESRLRTSNDEFRIPFDVSFFQSLMGVLRLDGFNWKACLRTTGIDGFDFDLMMVG